MPHKYISFQQKNAYTRYSKQEFFNMTDGAYDLKKIQFNSQSFGFIGDQIPYNRAIDKSKPYNRREIFVWLVSIHRHKPNTVRNALCRFH